MPRRWGRRLALAILLFVLALLAWFWQPLNARAVARASYDARIACSCHYVDGRRFDQCKEDVGPGLLIVLSQDAAAKSVTASVPVLASQTATYHEGAGCILESWTE